MKAESIFSEIKNKIYKNKFTLSMLITANTFTLCKQTTKTIIINTHLSAHAIFRKSIEFIDFAMPTPIYIYIPMCIISYFNLASKSNSLNFYNSYQKQEMLAHFTGRINLFWILEWQHWLEVWNFLKNSDDYPKNISDLD